MYTFQLSDRFLTKKELEIFEDDLIFYGLDNSIWEVFSCLFRSGTRYTKPYMLKIYKENELSGAIIITKCSRYGRALFDNKILSGIVNLIGIPYYQWIKFGCCMDMMSNPGFVKNPVNTEEVIKAAIQFLRKRNFLTIITDYTENSGLYEGTSILPALPHALIDCSNMKSILDYSKEYKNLKHKLNAFRNKGGQYTRVEQNLDQEQLLSLKQCFVSTAEKSVFYLPYQDLYLNAALNTSGTSIENTHYFIATMDGKFLGYQAALKTGQYLNALHGAFDRNRNTTYHAYDILFVKMTEFAIEQGLKVVDFGAVLNFTKQKMVNKTVDMSYFVLSRYSIVRWLFNLFLKYTKIQGHKQLKFKDSF